MTPWQQQLSTGVTLAPQASAATAICAFRWEHAAAAPGSYPGSGWQNVYPFGPLRSRPMYTGRRRCNNGGKAAALPANKTDEGDYGFLSPDRPASSAGPWAGSGTSASRSETAPLQAGEVRSRHLGTRSRCDPYLSMVAPATAGRWHCAIVAGAPRTPRRAPCNLCPLFRNTLIPGTMATAHRPGTQ